MRWPLRYQILLPMVSIMALTVAVVSALNAWTASARVKRQLEEQLADVSRTLSASNFPLESNVLRQMRGLTGADYVAVDEAGRAVAASDESLISEAEKGGDVATRLDLAAAVAIDERRFFHVALPIDRRAAGRERLKLHVFYSETAWREARWQAIWPSLAIGGVSIVLVVIFGTLLAGQVTRPIHELHLQVGRIAQGDFHTMAIPSREDEVKDLATAVNQMAERLVQYEEQIRSSERLRALGTLGGGIAHQLRNAATGCRIALDLHQRDCSIAVTSKRNAAEGVPYRGNGNEPLGVAVRQLDQIEASIQRLLSLGKPGVATPAKIDLAAVTSDALELVRPMALHMDVGLLAELPELSPIIQADSHSITQMVVNLAVNAVEAAAQARLSSNGAPVNKKGAVEIHLRPIADNRFELAVGNPGPGPSTAIQPRLFEPFATDKPGGIGLGLAVARQIAEDHGGSIRWQQQDRMTWFFVTLPAEATGKS